MLKVLKTALSKFTSPSVDRPFDFTTLMCEPTRSPQQLCQQKLNDLGGGCVEIPPGDYTVRDKVTRCATRRDCLTLLGLLRSG